MCRVCVWNEQNQPESSAIHIVFAYAVFGGVRFFIILYLLFFVEVNSRSQFMCYTAQNKESRWLRVIINKNHKNNRRTKKKNDNVNKNVRVFSYIHTHVIEWWANDRAYIDCISTFFNRSSTVETRTHITSFVHWMNVCVSTVFAQIFLFVFLVLCSLHGSTIHFLFRSNVLRFLMQIVIWKRKTAKTLWIKSEIDLDSFWRSDTTCHHYCSQFFYVLLFFGCRFDT